MIEDETAGSGTWRPDGDDHQRDPASEGVPKLELLFRYKLVFVHREFYREAIVCCGCAGCNSGPVER